MPAAVHHIVRADWGELQPGVIHLADDAEPSVMGGGQPPIPLAFQEPPASLEYLAGIRRAAECAFSTRVT